jgi:hypothetical protein
MNGVGWTASGERSSQNWEFNESASIPQSVFGDALHLESAETVP